MAARLNQIIAAEKGEKSDIYARIGVLHKELQKPELFKGLTKTYHPLEEGGTQLPEERMRVQRNVDEILKTVEKLSTEYFTVVAKKDWTNCEARADVTVDGVVLLEKVPVTFLLFFEKQLGDLKAIAQSLPVLDDADEWSKDENAGLFKTPVIKTHRTEKLSVPIVLLAPTPEHPGQAQLVNKDLLVGHWHLVKQSGAMPRPERERIVDRIGRLLIAVKEAREEANGAEIKRVPDIGTKVFDFILRG